MLLWIPLVGATTVHLPPREVAADWAAPAVHAGVTLVWDGGDVQVVVEGSVWRLTCSAVDGERSVRVPRPVTREDREAVLALAESLASPLGGRRRAIPAPPPEPVAREARPRPPRAPAAVSALRPEPDPFATTIPDAPVPPPTPPAPEDPPPVVLPPTPPPTTTAAAPALRPTIRVGPAVAVRLDGELGGGGTVAACLDLPHHLGARLDGDASLPAAAPGAPEGTTVTRYAVRAAVTYGTPVYALAGGGLGVAGWSRTATTWTAFPLLTVGVGARLPIGPAWLIPEARAQADLATTELVADAVVVHDVSAFSGVFALSVGWP